MSDASRLYISRKLGKGMKHGYKWRAFLPLFLLFIVTALLSFSMTFISSLSAEINRMIEVMGSGTIYALSDPSVYVPEEGEVAAVREGSALAYSENGESALFIKGVDPSYFSGMRSRELSFETFEGDAMNPVVISSSLSSELGLRPGNRFTLLLWDAEKSRTRPFLCTVKAVFDSVYPQLDSHLAYVPYDLLSSRVGYEALLPQGDGGDALLLRLLENGIPASSYKMMYSSLYGNVVSSIGILYIILASVALLAAFFSSDAVQVYMERDRKDIKELWILGLQRLSIKGIYFRMTLTAVAFSAVAGILAGVIIALLSPSVLSIVSKYEPELLEYYVRSFDVTVPWLSLAFMAVLEIIVSALSIAFSLRKRKGIALF